MNGLLPILHVMFALLASWRLVELFLNDRITAALRDKFPSYVWSCPRCLSVWSGFLVTLPLLWGSYVWWTPFLNWPLAISWTYFVYNEAVIARNLAKNGRQLVIQVNSSGQWAITKNDFTLDEFRSLMTQTLQTYTPPAPPASVPTPENMPAAADDAASAPRVPNRKNGKKSLEVLN